MLTARLSAIILYSSIALLCVQPQLRTFLLFFNFSKFLKLKNLRHQVIPEPEQARYEANNEDLFSIIKTLASPASKYSLSLLFHI